MANESERLQILEMIERGLITASEGVRLLNVLQGNVEEPLLSDAVDSEAPAQAAEAAASTDEAPPSPSPETFERQEEQPAMPKGSPKSMPPSIKKWRSWWWIPMWVGVAITVISGGLMFLAYQKEQIGFWFACTWFPFLLGVATMALAWASRTARWLHVRIQQEPGEWPQKIALSFPLPLRPVLWLLHIFRPRIPEIDGVNLDEAITMLEKITPDQPFYVEVDEDDGERVEVYIG